MKCKIMKKTKLVVSEWLLVVSKGNKKNAIKKIASSIQH